MAVGGCFCGNIRIEFNGQPITSGLCHCLDCRKLTGSHYSYSFVVNTAELKVTGSPKEVPKISDSGNTVRNYFCPDCGTPLYGWKIKPDGEPNDVTVVRAGIFDDIEMLDQRKPEAELFCGSRLKWMNPIEELLNLVACRHFYSLIIELEMLKQEECISIIPWVREATKQKSF